MLGDSNILKSHKISCMPKKGNRLSLQAIGKEIVSCPRTPTTLEHKLPHLFISASYNTREL